MTLALQQPSTESLIRWPPVIHRPFEPEDLLALVYAPPTQMDGLMDPMVAFSEPLACSGYCGFSAMACEQPVSAASSTAIQNPPQISARKPLPISSDTNILGEPRARTRERSPKDTSRHQKKLQRRNKTARSSPPPPKAIPTSDDPYKAKTIKANQTQDPNQWSEFDTGVDKLMRVIQTEDTSTCTDVDMSQWILTPTPSPKLEAVSSPVLAYLPALDPIEQTLPRVSEGGELANPSTQRQPRIKKFQCPGPNCGLLFAQKGHLNIHLRTHTGEKPFKCEHDGCDQYFSQRGNMKTHMRRHVGEKPYKCRYCDKAFVQGSIARSHERTHSPSKPFHCILDGCEKMFSSRGNMKQHQNVFHGKYLKELTRKFESFATQGSVPKEYLHFYEYFKTHYKNSNKGVKGRGKAHRVAERSSFPSAEHTKPSTLLQENIKIESPCVVDSFSREPYSPGVFDMLAPPSPMSVAGQIFPQHEDYATVMAEDSPFY